MVPVPEPGLARVMKNSLPAVVQPEQAGLPQVSNESVKLPWGMVIPISSSSIHSDASPGRITRLSAES